MSIPELVVAEVLTKSARHCCICRNFSPLSIQVHHIIEKSHGGTDELENLIPVCIQCHAYIHTKSNMTRNFTEIELKKARDIVYDMVLSGKLPAVRSLASNEIEALSASLAETLKKDKNEEKLSDESVEIITTMVCENSEAILEKDNTDYLTIRIGNQQMIKRVQFEGQYPDFIIELLSKNLVVVKGHKLDLTDKGQRLVRKLVKNTETFIQKKVKCLKCSLHFILCTWDMDRHNSSNLICPECGQNEGVFIVWTQHKFGFIFEHVPGNSVIFDFPQILKSNT